MVSHTVLLVVGGALLTGLLGALVFGSNGTAEERRIREQQNLLRALEAQRRVRDVQLMRQAKRQGQPHRERPPAPRAEAEPVAAEQMTVTEVAPRVDRRATALQRKREEKEQAAALKSQREAEKRARRQAEQERKSTAKAEQLTLRAVEQQQKQEAKAALKEEQSQAKARAAEARAQPQPAPPSPAATPAKRSATLDADEAKPLTELPLFSWAHDIDDDDAPSRDAS